MKPPKSVRELLDRYALTQLITAAGTTFGKFEISIQHLAHVLEHKPALSDLTNENVARLIRYLLTVRKIAEPSVNMYVKKILALWRFAFHEGFVKKWPTIQPIEEPEITPTAWTEDELRQLFAAIPKLTGFIGSIPAADWMLVYHLIAWDGGERPGGLISVKMNNVSLRAGWVKVDARDRKGRTRDKIIFIREDTVAAIRKIVEPKRDALLPFPHCYQTFINLYRRLLRIAGLPEDRKHLASCMRKSHHSHFENAGGDPSGEWSDPAVYRKYYRDPRVIKTRRASDVLFRPTG